jgi:hypothetical protein
MASNQKAIEKGKNGPTIIPEGPARLREAREFLEPLSALRLRSAQSQQKPRLSKLLHRSNL